MDLFYILNLLDFSMRLIIVSMLLLISLKIKKMDKDVMRSVAYLRHDDIRNAFSYIFFFTPFFLISSILEHPLFHDNYPEEFIHLIQDLSLFFFQAVVIYFLTIIYNILTQRTK